MIEVVRTNDLVYLNWVEALLRDASLNPFIADQHASILEGSGAALQQRILVPADEEARARRVLHEAGVAE